MFPICSALEGRQKEKQQKAQRRSIHSFSFQMNWEPGLTCPLAPGPPRAIKCQACQRNMGNLGGGLRWRPALFLLSVSDLPPWSSVKVLWPPPTHSPPAWASLSGEQLWEFPGYLSASPKIPIEPIETPRNAKKAPWDLWGREGRCQQLSDAHNSAIEPQLLRPFTAVTGTASFCLLGPGADVAPRMVLFTRCVCVCREPQKRLFCRTPFLGTFMAFS